jgi:hypothetical protein
MTTQTPFELAFHFARLFDSLDLRYYIGGSVASSYYGVSRATRDIDFCAELSLEHVGRFIAALKDEFYLSEESIKAAIASRRSFNLIHFATAYKIDIFIPGASQLDHQGLLRRKYCCLLPESPIAVALLSAEDSVLQKLRCYLAGGSQSTQQWQDILSIIKVHRLTLDRDYLRKWASVVSLNEVLDRAFSDSGFDSIS